MTEAPPHPPLYTIIDVRADDAAGQALARDIIAVHGPAAAAVVRQNATAAALAGQTIQAKSWIAVLGSVQRQQSSKDRGNARKRQFGIPARWLRGHR